MINDSSHSGKAQHVDAAAHEANHQAFGIGFQKKMGAGRIYMGNHAEIHIYLVGGWPTPLKNMSSSVGMMTFPYIMEKIKKMFETTANQYIYI